MIELLWPLLNERVAVQHPSTLVELEAAIQKAWDSITQAEIDARCAGFGSKVVEVVRKRGTC
jgi:hypothetical protein